MNKRLSFAFLGAALLATQCIQAQLSSQLGEFDHLPQRVYANPAFRPSGKINIGIPFLSGIYFEQSNNWIKPGEYLNISTQGVASIDYASLIDNLDKEAFMGFGNGIELLHAGVGFGNNYIHVRVAERVQGGIGLPRDFFALALYGNQGPNGFENHTADLSGLRLDIMHYREYAVGYNRAFGDRLSVGLTAKYLYGMEALRTAESSLQLRTDPLTYEMRTSGNLRFNTAGLGLNDDEQDIREDVGDYLLGLNNRGLGMDIGASYRPLEKLRLDFAANDFGFISWQSDVSNYGTSRADFAFDGVDFTDYVFLSGSEFDEALQDEVDQIAEQAQEAYNFEGSRNSFRSAMFGYFRYGAAWDIYETKSLSGHVWANLTHSIGHSNLPTRIAVGYNQRIWKALQIGLHYSKQTGDGGFLGGGLSMNAGPMQLYAMVENAQIARWSRYTIVDENNPQDRSQIVVPRNSSDIRIHFGLNLTFNRQFSTKPASKPMVR